MLEDFMNGPNRNRVAFLTGAIVGIIGFSTHPVTSVVDFLIIIFGGATLSTTIVVLMPSSMVIAIEAFLDKFTWSFSGVFKRER